MGWGRGRPPALCLQRGARPCGSPEPCEAASLFRRAFKCLCAPGTGGRFAATSCSSRSCSVPPAHRAFSGLKLPQGAHGRGLPGLPRLENSVVARVYLRLQCPPLGADGPIAPSGGKQRTGRTPSSPGQSWVSFAPGGLETLHPAFHPLPHLSGEENPSPWHTHWMVSPRDFHFPSCVGGSAGTCISWPREAKSLHPLG